MEADDADDEEEEEEGRVLLCPSDKEADVDILGTLSGRKRVS